MNQSNGNGAPSNNRSNDPHGDRDDAEGNAARVTETLISGCQRSALVDRLFGASFDPRKPRLAERCAEHFHRLREFAFDHPEAGAIFGATD